MKKEAYQQLLSAYQQGKELEISYTFRLGSKEFEGTTHGFIEDLDGEILVLTTNREEARKDVLSLERILKVKHVHATTASLAGHVT